MRRVEELLEDYNPTDKTEQKKILLINWFQKHPGERFDIAEIHEELGDELGVGQTRTGQILKELEEDSVLKSHGKQRKAYQLANDLLIPVRYQALAGLRHLWTVVDVKRWGMVGHLVISTILWFFLTFPFWFFSIILVVSPTNHIGPLSEPEILIFTLIMTIWLLILTICTASLQLLRRWWIDRTGPK